ncbi:TatD family hydrolase [bacterium]|nr:TatD family hydrolase [bacterium]
MHYIDTHCHLFLNDEGFSFDPEIVVKNSIKAGVKQIWLSSTNVWDIKRNLALTSKYPENLKTFVGFHPEDYLEYDSSELENILKVYCRPTTLNPGSLNPKSSSPNPIAGIGEVGVDLHWNDISTKDIQMQVFKDQIELALKYDLPVAVHSRDAYELTIEVLEKYKNLKFIWHSYNLDSDTTKKLLGVFPNIYFGFNAVITYKSGIYIQESIKVIPDDKIVLETDAPFLSPRTKESSNRGYNTSEGVIDVYQAVSKIRGLSVEKLQRLVIKNCSKYINN